LTNLPNINKLKQVSQVGKDRKMSCSRCGAEISSKKVFGRKSCNRDSISTSQIKKESKMSNSNCSRCDGRIGPKEENDENSSHDNMPVSKSKRVSRVSISQPNYANRAIAWKIIVGLDCTFDEGVKRLRKTTDWLWLTSRSKGKSVPSKEVDQTWHVFLLFTKEYQDFCFTHCVNYIHHVPQVPREFQSN